MFSRRQANTSLRKIKHLLSAKDEKANYNKKVT